MSTGKVKPAYWRPSVLSRDHRIDANRRRDGFPENQSRAGSLLDRGDRRFARSVSDGCNPDRGDQSQGDEGSAELLLERGRGFGRDLVNVWGGDWDVRVLEKLSCRI